MKRLSAINGMIDKIKGDRVNTWFDKFGFMHILIIWISIVALFGVLYAILSTDYSHLIYTKTGEPVQDITQQIYFSFITATTTGFGDIVPVGYFKILSVFEVVFGFLLLAFVTSKLVSIKQNVILNEIYDISFRERINRLRSSLLVFRQNVNRLINNIESGIARKREINDVYIYISSFEDTLNDVANLLTPKSQNVFTKAIDPLNAELVFNSVLQSFEKIHELIILMEQNKLDWRRDVTVELIMRCKGVTDNLFAVLNSNKNISEKALSDLNAQRNRIFETIKADLMPAHSKPHHEAPTLEVLDEHETKTAA
jgi:hypothetical protein